MNTNKLDPHFHYFISVAWSWCTEQPSFIMVDVEIIEFKAPTGAAKLIFLTKIQSHAGHEEAAISEILLQHFSQWGLVHSVRLLAEDDEEKTYLAYLRYYSVQATASARRHNNGRSGILEDLSQGQLGVDFCRPFVLENCAGMSFFFTFCAF